MRASRGTSFRSGRRTAACQNLRVLIGVLGPLVVRGSAGGAVEVPGARLRGLLVALALRPGQVVAKGALVDWIWGERPPADAVNALQRLVSRLRKLLPDGLVEGRPDGYRLVVDPEAVDAVRFERLLGAARSPATTPTRAYGCCARRSTCGGARPSRTSGCGTATRATPRPSGWTRCAWPPRRSATTPSSPSATALNWSPN